MFEFNYLGVDEDGDIWCFEDRPEWAIETDDCGRYNSNTENPMYLRSWMPLEYSRVRTELDRNCLYRHKAGKYTKIQHKNERLDEMKPIMQGIKYLVSDIDGNTWGFKDIPTQCNYLWTDKEGTRGHDLGMLLECVETNQVYEVISAELKIKPIQKAPPNDTPVLVRNSEDDNWKSRHSAGEFKYGYLTCWHGGGTSWTTCTKSYWKFWKLPE